MIVLVALRIKNVILLDIESLENFALIVEVLRHSLKERFLAIIILSVLQIYVLIANVSAKDYSKR